VKRLLTIVTFCGLLGIYTDLSAGVIINEAMSDGPADPSGLTWIEVYNDSNSFVVLTGMALVSGRTVSRLADIMVQPHGYLVICNRMFGPESFESRWGDNSGVWGDRGFESTFALSELPVAMLGATDSVVLSTADGTILSALRWSLDSNSRSWERTPLSGDSAKPCLFGSGGTPGEINSSLTVVHDLSIESVTVRPDWPTCEIAVAIRNVGTEVSQPTNLVFTRRSNSGYDTIASEAIPALSTGVTYTVVTSVAHQGVWLPATTMITDDERLTNNHSSFVIVGDDYPPVVLSEIMAAPLPNSGGEWIEIRRRSDTAVDLQGWSIGDASHRVLLSDTALMLNDSIAILIQSESDFVTAYGVTEAPLIRPASWVTLNNNGDNIRLVDPYGIEADGCQYEALPDDGKTLARSAESGISGKWLISVDSGGTPGAPNRVIEASSSGPILATFPQTITPDDDGENDALTLSIVIPSRSQCTLRIFDRYGRVVRTLLSDQELSSNNVIWDGRDMSGGRLPIGIYVALLEVEDGTSVRKAVVLAR
jgi:gliding motility-associated-like protein